MFYFGYIGNKRQEIKYIEIYIKNLIDNGTINKIVEPFCGSSSFSYHFYKIYGDKIEYHLNDIDENLISFLNIVKKEGSKSFFDDTNEKCKDLTKERFNNIINNRKPNDLNSWFFYNKVYNFRKGLYPDTRKYGDYDYKKYMSLDDFFKNDKTFLYNNSYTDIFEKFKDDEKALIFLDPPYLDSFNGYYSTFNKHNTDDGTIIDNTEMYSHIGDLFNNNSKVLLIMNDMGLIRYVYKPYYKFSYDKNYSFSKKIKDTFQKNKTKHAIFSNFIL